MTTLFHFTGKALGALAVVFLIVLLVPGICENVYGQTPGYWKNHSDPTSPQYDEAWNAVGGPGTQFLSTGRTWLEELNTSPQGNAFHILGHQYIAAYLNMVSARFELIHALVTPAVSESEIGDMVQRAEDILRGHKLSSMRQTEGSVSYRSTPREEYISLADVLDEYNNLVAEQRELNEQGQEANLTAPGRKDTTWGWMKVRFGSD